MEIHQAGSTVYIQLNTHKSDGTPITWAGSPAVAVVKDGGTTTETDGVSLAVDAGGVTGRHIATIDTSQDATFFATGHKFSVIVTAGTVDGVSTVGMIVAAFQLGEVPADVRAWNGGALPVPAVAGDAMTLTEAYDAAKTAAPSAATVADAVWDEAISGHAEIGSFGSKNQKAVPSEDAADYMADVSALALEDTVEAVGGKVDALQDLSAAEVEDALEAYGAAKPADLVFLDVAISSRLAADDYVVPPTVEEINAKLETEHGAGSWGAQGAYTIVPSTPLTDSVTGLAIPGMAVKIYSNALRTETYLVAEATSNTAGSFTAHVTAPGTYYLRAIKEGYTTLEWTEVAA